MAKPKVHLFCGLVGAGKTTLSRRIAQETAAVRFSLDEWMIRLYGLHYEDPDYVARLDGCKALIWDVAVQVLSTGHDVVLDWNQWSRARRAEWATAARNAGADPVLHLLDVPVETVIARAIGRADRDPVSHSLDEMAVRHMASILEMPDADEGIEVVLHR